MDQTGSTVAQVGIAGMQISAAVVEFLNAILTSAKKRSQLTGHEMTDSETKGARLLLEHLKKGGSLLSDTVSPREADVFAQYLKAYKIPFTATKVKDVETAEDRILFMTRDTDSKLMQQVRERYLYELKVGLGEMSTEALAKLNDGLNIGVIPSLSDEEVEVFRHHVAKEDISYAIEKTPDGKNSIWFGLRDEQGVNNALLKTGYDLAGEDGAKYRADLAQDIYNRTVFDKSIVPGKGETLYVVDSRNPGEFIAVTKQGFSKHSLDLEEQKLIDGSIKEVVRDKNSVAYTSFDRDKLMDLAKTLYRPVILKESDMEFVKKVSKEGSVSLIPDVALFRQAYLRTFDRVSERKDYYMPVRIRDVVDPDKQIFSLVNLPAAMLDRVRELKLENVAIVNETLAYTDKSKAQIDRLASEYLYNGLDPVKEIEARFLYEGRGRLDLSDASKTQYIVNADYTGFLFKLDGNGLTITNLYEPSKAPTVIERDSKTFREYGLSLFNKMETPIVLSKEEYEQEPEKRMETIRERLPKNLAADARSFVFDTATREKEELVDPAFDIESGSEKQRQAVKFVDRYPKQVHMVDRNLLEKIADHTADRKAVESRSYSNREVPQNISPDIDL